MGDFDDFLKESGHEPAVPGEEKAEGDTLDLDDYKPGELIRQINNMVYSTNPMSLVKGKITMLERVREVCAQEIAAIDAELVRLKDQKMKMVESEAEAPKPESDGKPR